MANIKDNGIERTLFSDNDDESDSETEFLSNRFFK